MNDIRLTLTIRHMIRHDPWGRTGMPFYLRQASKKYKPGWTIDWLRYNSIWAAAHRPLLKK